MELNSWREGKHRYFKTNPRAVSGVWKGLRCGWWGCQTWCISFYREMVDEQCLVVKKDDDRMNMLIQSPPCFFTPNSYELSNSKRARVGSISQRLRSVSDLEESGVIDKSQKGVLKDLVISGDEALQAALDTYEGGDLGPLSILMKHGLLDRWVRDETKKARYIENMMHMHDI